MIVLDQYKRIDLDRDKKHTVMWFSAKNPQDMGNLKKKNFFFIFLDCWDLYTCIRTYLCVIIVYSKTNSYIDCVRYAYIDFGLFLHLCNEKTALDHTVQ